MSRRSHLDRYEQPHPDEVTFQQSTRHRRIVRVLVATLATLAVLAAGYMLVVASMFSGGIDDLVSFNKPQPGDRRVLDAAAWSGDEVTSLTTSTGGAVAASIGDRARRVGGADVRPPCEVGQHNWKIDDDFDLRCELSTLDVIVVSGREEFAAQSADIKAQLSDAGWTPEPIYGGGNTYDPADLDLSGFTSVKGENQITVAFLDSTATPEDISYLLDDYSFRDVVGRWIGVDDILDQIPDDGYAVTLTVTREYFRD